MDVAKYTLATYALISFDKVVIRFECEDSLQSDEFYEYCRELYPQAMIQPWRSDSALKYVTALKSSFYGNPWVFFSPNNDHPFIGVNPDLSHYLAVAEKFEERHGDAVIGVYYSHMTDMLSMMDFGAGLWGKWEFVFPKKIYEDDFCVVLKMNKFCGDSIQILRLNKLLRIFEKNTNSGRVVRIEDTSVYFDSKIKHLIVVPKKEICRHFDASFHTKYWPKLFRAPQPVFIPEGFFANDIRIKYGYHQYVEGFVNVNPLVEACRYIDGNGPDVNFHVDDIPFSWRQRVKSIDSAQNNALDELAPDDTFYRKNLLNPWWPNSVGFMALHSVCAIIRFPFYYIWVTLRRKVYSVYGEAFLYRYLVRIKDRFIRRVVLFK